MAQTAKHNSGGCIRSAWSQNPSTEVGSVILEISGGADSPLIRWTQLLQRLVVAAVVAARSQTGCGGLADTGRLESGPSHFRLASVSRFCPPSRVGGRVDVNRQSTVGARVTVGRGSPDPVQ